MTLPADTLLLEPAPSYDELRVVTSSQEQAVSAINRDVFELVGRQKVALNDVLEENQRLQIRYNNLRGSYDIWSQQVTLNAEKELVHKLASAKDELASNYDGILDERTRRFAGDTATLRADNESLISQLLSSKEDKLQTMVTQQAQQASSDRLAARLAVGALIVILTLVSVLIFLHLAWHKLDSQHRRLEANFDALQRRATANESYLSGNGFKSALVKMLKSNLPHSMFDAASRPMTRP